MGSLRILGASLGLLALSACGQSVGAPVERLAMDRLESGPGVYASPDTAGAQWAPLANGALSFGKAGQVPLMTIACDSRTSVPHMRVVRYAPADPGAKAMLAIIGHGRVLRVKTDAVRHSEGWRWEGLVPADDIHLEVFAGTGPIEATLPGGGTFRTGSSAEPARLFGECRKQARAKTAQAS